MPSEPRNQIGRTMRDSGAPHGNSRLQSPVEVASYAPRLPASLARLVASPKIADPPLDRVEPQENFIPVGTGARGLLF